MSHDPSVHPQLPPLFPHPQDAQVLHVAFDPQQDPHPMLSLSTPQFHVHAYFTNHASTRNTTAIQFTHPPIIANIITNNHIAAHSLVLIHNSKSTHAVISQIIHNQYNISVGMNESHLFCKPLIAFIYIVVSQVSFMIPKARNHNHSKIRIIPATDGAQEGCVFIILKVNI